ncbi:TPA: diacylglycerol kinase [candidate division CPR2 bacterium]|uniref:Dihydrofolate reductase n=1 Tax=candidate division CPR2 bacterium GW2011_GWC1_41_48 TaxID=1618344 RepID=A0A0G0YJP2_UNCC2|nr:MAG: Dihydrofolate reductase [candidate division CPR2 bacterium GW2011_GWC2_39_35]KKR28568.1 MAG: Dihydrofolate reductase [candidate division CPR2 bacterium GW2011_GWD1_39_7]KKR29423.1 MAG: Dihydrofolate reductase [candidate division CPR2 bacterium GW2011_GWD2_39_7]KKS09746.1 MAG: dihydrofolate reductase, dihydrofolate reductase [candidate division CPR2 bacterium GW2011_GWC1_41_48]OGB61013.1 MAG: hypothetical protein A2Y27_02935 [candidate division CPR2 bacterium GWD1_39_7]OGB71244.1 MAG: h
MSKPRISIICAIAENRAIGKDNKLLWHIPNDLKRFRELTLGCPVIMGKNTFESIGNALPGRLNIILTSNRDNKYEGCVTCNTLKKALTEAKGFNREEIFVIGGGQIYAQTIGIADRLYLTIVEGEYEADTFFPDYSKFTKKVSDQKEENEGYKYRYLTLER